jgi:hypothetical protein
MCVKCIYCVNKLNIIIAEDIVAIPVGVVGDADAAELRDGVVRWRLKAARAQPQVGRRGAHRRVVGPYLAIFDR